MIVIAWRTLIFTWIVSAEISRWLALGRWSVMQVSKWLRFAAAWRQVATPVIHVDIVSFREVRFHARSATIFWIIGGFPVQASGPFSSFSLFSVGVCSDVSVTISVHAWFVWKWSRAGRQSPRLAGLIKSTASTIARFGIGLITRMTSPWFWVQIWRSITTTCPFRHGRRRTVPSHRMHWVHSNCPPERATPTLTLEYSSHDYSDAEKQLVPVCCSSRRHIWPCDLTLAYVCMMS